MLLHKENNTFYFGSRCANKVEAEEDLGLKYFTSSTTVKPCFFDFEPVILKKFIERSEAIDYENKMIQEYWKIPGLLNKSVFTDNKVCYFSGKSDNFKKKLSVIHTGKPKPFNLGEKNYHFGKGHQIKGALNPNARKWLYRNVATGEEIIIEDLMQYCIDKQINYQTMHSRRKYPGKRAQWHLIEMKEAA